MLDNNTDLNQQEGDGFTALHMAARNGQVKVVELLLERKADPDMNNNSSWLTPLEAAYLCVRYDGGEEISAEGCSELLWAAQTEEISPDFGEDDILAMDSIIGEHVYHVTRTRAPEAAKDASLDVQKLESIVLEQSLSYRHQSSEEAVKQATEQQTVVDQCPLNERRQKVARECFIKLDEDTSGALSKSEFKIILAHLNPGITDEQVEKTFKKAKIKGDEMDVQGFYKWAHKMFSKMDDLGFDEAMSMMAKSKPESAAAAESVATAQVPAPEEDGLVPDESLDLADADDVSELVLPDTEFATVVFRLTAGAGGDKNTVRREDLLAAHNGDFKVFEGMDTDASGDITLEEWNTFLKRKMKAKGKKGQMWVSNFLNTLNVNLNKTLALADLGLAKTVFRQIAAVGGDDKTVRKEDLIRAHRGDFKIFDSMDMDDSGEVTETEWIAYLRDMKRIKGAKNPEKGEKWVSSFLGTMSQNLDEDSKVAAKGK